MKQYTTKYGQNIYDIAIVLYGSIEGIFDILVNNANINVNDEIPAGTVIQYDETFIINPQIRKALEDDGVNVANSTPGYCCSIVDDKTLRIIVDQCGATSSISVCLMSGTMYIDWGDGSSIDIVETGDTVDFDLYCRLVY